jgi:predicted Zn-dependent peptidase
MRRRMSAHPNAHFDLMTPAADTHVTLLANGVRVVTIHAPHLATASVSVFVRSGSAHEPRALNGISHVVEHMVFKGTRTRDSRRINLDAERLGAQVDAHTDKDHSAFHMRGLAQHAGDFIGMLGDIVGQPTFPADELEHERQVLLHEFVEVEDDPVSTAFKLFDHACWGLHPVAQPVIGTRGNIERFARDDLAAWVGRQVTGANVIVAVAGPVDAGAMRADAEAAFGALPAGTANLLLPPLYGGGVKTRAVPGSSQVHLVLGFGIPGLQQDDPAHRVAAALFGDGMSSPLMAELRERRGLVYHAACSADVMDGCGQFVIEASTAPEQLAAVLDAVLALLAQQAATITSDDLERAHNQLAVRDWRAFERPAQRLEGAALDLFALGRVRAPAETLARTAAVGADELRSVFARLLSTPASLAVTGKLGRGAGQSLRDTLGRAGLLAAG